MARRAHQRQAAYSGGHSCALGLLTLEQCGRPAFSSRHSPLHRSTICAFERPVRTPSWLIDLSVARAPGLPFPCSRRPRRRVVRVREGSYRRRRSVLKMMVVQKEVANTLSSSHDGPCGSLHLLVSPAAVEPSSRRGAASSSERTLFLSALLLAEGCPIGIQFRELNFRSGEVRTCGFRLPERSASASQSERAREQHLGGLATLPS